MKGKGLATGKFYFFSSILTATFIFTLIVVALLCKMSVWLTLLIFGWAFLLSVYFILFACTKYYIDDNSIRTISVLPSCRKLIASNQISFIKIVKLNFSEQSRYTPDKYYVISSTNAVEWHKGIMRTMRLNNSLICILKTKKSEKYITQFAERCGLSIGEE